MQVGFLTNCLRHYNLPDIIQWAAENEFKRLEVACWPHDSNTVDPSLDVTNFDAGRAQELNSLVAQHGITIDCLTFCANTLACDPARRGAIVEHLYRVVDAAQLLGVGTVSAFIGRDETKRQAENFSEMEKVFGPLLDYAAARGVRIAVENCPMISWDMEGLPGNLAYSPRIWDEMFRRLPHPNFGLNLDPSHLLWLGIDWNRAAEQYAPRIFHTHAKDTETFPDKRDRYSIADAWSHTWWEYRVPGRGEIDWKRWVQTLSQIGYTGSLSIELEDPDYSHSDESVKQGLLLGKQNLEKALS